MTETETVRDRKDIDTKHRSILNQMTETETVMDRKEIDTKHRSILKQRHRNREWQRQKRDQPKNKERH